MIQRKEYLEKLISWREKQIIKVITGVRRCGKSTLFALYIQHLKNSGVSDDQIVSVNLEDIDYENLLDYKSLYTYINKRLIKGKYTYVFIDEVQECQLFEKVIDSLFIKENVDVYVTGSNASMLSGELATLLSGRYVEIMMLPLSFSEYITFAEETSVPVNFSKYLKFGSFPYIAYLNNNDEMIRTYIDGIYNTILVKDVATRAGINDISVLESIVKFLCDNIGNSVSTKKISDAINASGRKISVNTVDNYLRALTQSYIFYSVDRYDIKGKNFLKTLGKYYLVDTGIRNLLLPGSTTDFGRLLENIVFLELLRRGYKVSIGKLAEKEIDFIATNANGITYFQVSASVLDSGTLARELEPLQKTPDDHLKILLTMDNEFSPVNHNGIHQIYLLNWLLETS